MLRGAVLLFAFLGLASPAGSQAISATTRTVVIVLCSADDGLTQRLCAEVEKSFRKSPEFKVDRSDWAHALMVRIPTNVDWERVQGKVRVHYSVEFLAAENIKLGSGEGSCDEHRLSACARQIVLRAIDLRQNRGSKH